MAALISILPALSHYSIRELSLNLSGNEGINESDLI